jgi:hypothetical protein
MAAKKGKGKKKDKGRKAKDLLAIILTSIETMSEKLDKLEKMVESSRLEPKRQGIRTTKGVSEPKRLTGSPAATGGRGQRVTKKKTTTRKKSVAGKVARKKAITKKTAAKKNVTQTKAVARNVTRKKTLQRRATTRKVAPKKTRAKRK